ncbi:hypothetical protein V1478_001382 [Vespula squamosa]|uniref:Uncharacterized protein n=1 Tax=Vespula squamosa TaxID=30214 RepID=A0ABD2C1A3_VESSQ
MYTRAVLEVYRQYTYKQSRDDQEDDLVIINHIDRYDNIQQYVWTSTYLIDSNHRVLPAGGLLVDRAQCDHRVSACAKCFDYFATEYVALKNKIKSRIRVSVVRRLEFLGRVNESKTRIYVIFLLKSYVRRVVRIINTLSANSVEEDCVAINIVRAESVNLNIHPLHLYRRIINQRFNDSTIHRVNDSTIIQPTSRHHSTYVEGDECFGAIAELLKAKLLSDELNF